MEQRAALWTRWKAGESMSDIGRALGKRRGSIFAFLAVQGGIVRPPRRRAAGAVTSDEAEQASRGVAPYGAVPAAAGGWRRAERPKPCRLALQPALCGIVAAKLRLEWSPEQI